VTLLGVLEHPGETKLDERHPLEGVFARAVAQFQQGGLRYKLEVGNGAAESVIPERVKGADVLTVLGPLGRPRLRRWFSGRSIGRLMADIAGPILYVPQVCLPLKRLLIAVGGLGYELTAEHLAIRIAAQVRAEITILHVVPPVDLDYPTARTMHAEWKHLGDSNTPVGRRIRKALETARNAGLSAQVSARQGLVTEEILAELKEGSYDMVCMGSPYSATSLRQLYSANVTADIAAAVRCPVLTARFVPEPLPSKAGSEF
jgi:nucleotide-binding universal stress UspA family protein